MTGFKKGDKGIFIRSCCGNEGKIVIVTGAHHPCNLWKGLYYPDSDLVVQSLGLPMRNSIGEYEMEGPVASSQLRKLPDVPDEEIEDKQEREFVIVR